MVTGSSAPEWSRKVEKEPENKGEFIFQRRDFLFVRSSAPEWGTKVEKEPDNEGK